MEAYCDIKVSLGRTFLFCTFYYALIIAAIVYPTKYKYLFQIYLFYFLNITLNVQIQISFQFLINNSVNKANL